MKYLPAVELRTPFFNKDFTQDKRTQQVIVIVKTQALGFRWFQISSSFESG